MAEHNDLGKKGEEKAIEYLESKSFTIIEKNWRSGNKEIDIIASNKDFLIIVEVKSRTYNFIEHPNSAVTRSKQKLIISATNTYVNKFEIDNEVRFDIISVIFKGTSYKIEHIEDAFYPIV